MNERTSFVKQKRKNTTRKEEDEERNGDEGGVSVRAAATCKTTLGRAIYRGPSPAPYRFNFKLKFMNGLLPFFLSDQVIYICIYIYIRTFSGPSRRVAILPGRGCYPRRGTYLTLSVASRTFI